MRIFVSTLGLTVAMGAFVACGDKKDDDDEEEAAPLASAEEALASLPAAGQLAISMEMTPSTTGLVEDDDPCGAITGYAALPCATEASVSEMATFIDSFIERLRVAPVTAGESGTWYFTETLTTATNRLAP